MAFKTYQVNGKAVPVELKDEKTFLEECKNKNIQPILISGDPSSSAEDVDVEQKSAASIPNPYLKSGELKPEEFISALEQQQKSENNEQGEFPKVTSDITKRDEGKAINMLEEMYTEWGFTFEGTGNIASDEITITADNGESKEFKIDASIFDIGGDNETAVEITKWMNDRKVNKSEQLIQEQLDLVKNNNDKIKKDTENDFDQFYEDAYFNDVDVPVIKQQAIGDQPEFEAQEGGYVFSVPEEYHKNPERELNEEIQKKYDATVRDVAIQDYIKQSGLNLSGLSEEEYSATIQEIAAVDQEGNPIKKDFAIILDQVKQEAKQQIHKRAELKRQLNNDEISEIKYNEEIEKINQEDRFHTTVAGSIARDRINGDFEDQIWEETKDIKGSERNAYENMANEELENVREKTSNKIDAIGVVYDKITTIDNELIELTNWFDNPDNNIETNIDFFKSDDFMSDEKNRIAEIEEYAKTVVKNDRIKEIDLKIEELSKGEYTTNVQVSSANYLITSLKHEREDIVDAINTELDELYEERNSLADSINLNAREGIQLIIDEYRDKHWRHEYLRKNGLEYVAISEKLEKDLEELNLSHDELSILSNVMKRNPSAVVGVLGRGANAMIESIKNFGEFTVGNMPTDLKEETYKNLDNPVIEGVMRFVDIYTSPNSELALLQQVIGGDFIKNEKTGEKESLWDVTRKSIGDWQEEAILSRIKKPVSYDEIDSLFSWQGAEWVAGMTLEQAPVLATLALTGGTAGLAIISATAAGGKYDQLNKDTELFNQTGGIYGHNYDYGTMWLNSMVSGTAEGVSERVTAGILGKTIKKVFKTNRVAKLGFKQHLNNKVFTFNNLASTGAEQLSEGFSETLASMSSNMADIISGNKDVNIWDGVEEAFVSGVTIAGVLQSPRLITSLAAPFKSADTNKQLGEIGKRMKAITNRIAEISNNPSANPIRTKSAKEEIEKLQEEYASLVDRSNTILQNDIKRVDLLHPTEKKTLIEIEKLNYKSRQDAEKVNADSSLSKEQRQEKLKELQSKVDSRNERKQQILNKYSLDDIEKNYQRTVDWIKGYQEKINKMGGVKLNLLELTASAFQKLNIKDVGAKSKAEVENVAMENEAFIESLNKIVENKNGNYTEAEINDAKNLIQESMGQFNLAAGVLFSKSDYGVMIPKFRNGKLVSMDIAINKDAALEDGEFGVAAHEFVHSAFRKVLQGDPNLRGIMGDQINKILSSKGVSFKNEFARKKYISKLQAYDQSEVGEEMLAFVGEMLIKGDIIFNDSILQKMKNLVRRWSQRVLGYSIKFDTTEDVKNFLRDYKASYDNNDVSPAIAKLLSEGANGKLFKETRTTEEINKQKSWSRAVDLNRRNNPDLKREFDQYLQNEDNSRKYKNHEMFKDSPDFYNAYLGIVEGRALDGLIQHGMTELGLPPEALREFTRTAKEEVGRRFIENFNFDKNESLFGWLTGVSGGAGKSIIYRAKGDVMKRYVKEQKAQQVSIDKPIGESGRISDIIKDEKDTLIDQIENADMTPTVKRELKKDISDLKYVKDMLGLPDSTVESISDIVKTANVSLEDLTYKGIKDLLVSTDGKATSEKKITPTGPLFGVLNAISTEFGIDPLRILAKQDLNAEQRLLAQEYIFDKSTNEDGSFNKVLLDVLPEGETRSGEATGVANTKLGELYKTGSRLRVAEGASKKLGQKKAQIKRKNISRNEFLNLFGINPDGSFIPGTKADGAIRALVVQIAQMAANQDIRINAAKNNLASSSIIAKLGDGKSDKVFSKNTQNIYRYNLDDIANEFKVKRPPRVTAFKEESNKTYLIPDKDARYSKTETWGEAGARIANKFISINPNLRDILRTTMSGGITISWFGVTGEFDNQVATNNVEQDKTNKFKFNKKKLYDKNRHAEIKTKKFLDNNNKKLPLLKKTFKAIENYLQKNPKDAWFFIEMLENTSNNQSAFTRALAPFMFYPVDINGKPVFNEEVVEEHTDPQSQVGRALLVSAIRGEVDNIWPVVGKSFMQGSLRKTDDKLLGLFKLTSDMPDVYFEKIVPRLRDGSLKLPSGMSSVVRMAFAGINLNNYKLITGETITEFFNVGIKNASPGVVEIQNDLIIRQLTGEISKKKAIEELNSRVKEENLKVVSDIKKNVILETGLEVRKLNNTISSKSKKRQTAAEQIKILEDDLKKRGYKFSGTVSSSEFKRIGDMKIDISTKEGRDFIKDMESIPTVSSSEPGRITRGMSTFDFDETLIIDGKNFVVATNPKTGEVENISSEDWPSRGTELMEQGWDFNFDDFVNVRGGIKGPLFQKLLNRIEKYGPKNNFILTARPQESAIAIHGWLKSKGVNIPLRNITGLGSSVADAKANWILNKYKEGYNDMYFVDDALQNVEAVKYIMDQLDIKGNSVQAKLKNSGAMKSKSINVKFNEMLERTKGVAAIKRFSESEARRRGLGKGKFDFFVPPSAEDFKGLLYKFLGTGKQGDADLKWFKEVLLDPFAKGIRAWNTYKQNMANEYTSLRKAFPDVAKSLSKLVKGTSFTNDTAVRVYLWNKAGFEIPGISKSLMDNLVKHVNNNPELKSFADTLSRITKRSEGYIEPSRNWMVQSIASDLNTITGKVGRVEFLSEWKLNKDLIFSEENLNKIEAIYGSGYRDALENILYRMENGTNRVVGKDKVVNKFLDWINGSVGAVMFFNIRSAALQTISTVNFINWGDNNIFKAAAAFANQKQFWNDFSFIFNSDMLKQRRAGLRIDVSASELTKAFNEGKGKAEAVLAWLLEKGFTPTQIADSFAIAMGGSTFYRNRINKYLKEGMNQKQAQDQAWLDFQEIAEETQQSSRPDLISAQQAGVLGRIILAWQNTPMQMTRLTKKALSDIVNNRGDMKSNISRLIYYGLAQNLIFGALQTGLAFIMFGEEEEEIKKKELRVANGALDTLLRGTGVYGALVSTLKNTIIQWDAQRQKKYGQQDFGKVILEAINLSPPIGSKLRKINNAIKTWEYNKGVPEKMKYRIENPALSVAANIIEALTNFPMARLINKANNVEEALTGNHELWQRVALLSGWNKWDIGVKDEELEQAKKEVKEERKIQKDIEKAKKKEEEKKAREEEKKKEQEEKEAQGIKKVRCSAIKSNGKRCNMIIETKAKSAKCVYHKSYDEKEGSDMDGDGVKEFRCTATTSSGKRCKNRTENKNKKCYAHQ